MLLFLMNNGGIQIMLMSTFAVCSSCKQPAVHLELFAICLIVSDISAAVEI